MDLTYLKTLLGFVSNRTHDTTTSILAYWEVLEYFQELSFPQASKSGLPEDEVRVRYVRSEDELKYFIYAPYRDADSFRLYVGGVPKYDLLSELYRLIPADKDNERFRKLLEKNKSVSVLYTIDLSPSGEYIEGSFQLSPYIWAISCLIHDREVDEEWLEELLEDGNDFFMTIEDEEGIEFFSLLRQKTVELLDRLRIRSLFTVNDGFRRNDLERVCARALKSDDKDLSISFYAKDLSRVRKSLLDKRPNRLLVNYINAPLMSGGNRQSICSIENYRKWLGPERYPLGRWPSEFSPALMQQMAINIALAEENAGGCGIFSVNGPPGTGKTSIAKSIARAMNRKYVRVSLGGVRDEAEIRGHRRTYIGALPGRILAGMKQAGVKNPVFLLDEIDKMTSDMRGDPSSAMLEVLDPEQNNTFSDHFLELPFDLSKVFWITTANVLSDIPRPLMDRMEIIDFTSYTEEEKVQIAKRYLVPKQVKENGLRPSQAKFSDAVLRRIIEGYTRESGVRNLEKTIGTVCRRIGKSLLMNDEVPLSVSVKNLEKLLGPVKFLPETVHKDDEVGIVTGMAWTQVGGEVLETEAVAVKGKGRLLLTGQLGDVMKESAEAGVTYVRSRADVLGIDADFYANMDLHIHLPEGAIPKDGPSAGITMATAITSALTGKAVRHDVAMTGEITLRGTVLPVGGIKEKVIAAHRAGIKKILCRKKQARYGRRCRSRSKGCQIRLCSSYG